MTQFKQVLVENTWMNKEVIDCGWGNGYVLIPKDHPLAGMDTLNFDGDSIEDFLSVHGGVTFTNYVDDRTLKDYHEYLSEEDRGKCMIGFDTAHAGDNTNEQNYEYVKEETQKLHDQLVEFYDKIKVWKQKKQFSREEVKELINSFADYHGIHWLDPKMQEWISKYFEPSKDEDQ